MKEKQEKKLERLNKKRFKRLMKYEKLFSTHNYKGKGKKYIETIDGKSAIAVIAPYAVNCFDVEERKADIFSGGLVRLLAYEVGCHAIYVRKSFNQKQRNKIKSTIGRFIKKNNIAVFLDFQVVDNIGDSIIELCPYQSEIENKYAFVNRVIRYSFEYEYRDLGIEKVVRFNTSVKHNISFDAVNEVAIVAEQASKNSHMSYVYVGINKKYLAPTDYNAFIRLYNTIQKTVAMLTNMDWNADTIKVYRLWQSPSHKPQDKVEIINTGVDKRGFSENCLLNVCTYGPELEKVRLHKLSNETKDDLKNTLGNNANIDEYIFLTNRLIEILFGREWIEGREEDAGLRGAPVIVYENKKEVYPIGMPKANQIDGVSFSSALYDAKKDEAAQFDYVIFNRYTDSRLFIDYDKADYGDFGRVKDDKGLQAKKVMIPRYYKRLLGYLECPLNMIRSEEYKGILEKIDEEDERKAFKECYKKIDGEPFYKLKNIYSHGDDRDEEDKEEDSDIKKNRAIVKRVQEKNLRLLSNVEVLRIPKEIKPKEKLYKRILHKIDKLKIAILKKAIGKSEYLLKTGWTNATDDRNNIARLSPNMMSLLGVSENDKIVIKFGKKQEILRVLANDKLTDYQIGIPAPARKKLGMNSVNDIVIVHRDMIHIFWRHSEEQTIAILGTVLAVFQVITKIWIGVILCLIVTPLIMYFVLNEERVKVK